MRYADFLDEASLSALNQIRGNVQNMLETKLTLIEQLSDAIPSIQTEKFLSVD